MRGPVEGNERRRHVLGAVGGAILILLLAVGALAWRAADTYSDARRDVPAPARRALRHASGGRHAVLVIGDDSRTGARGNADAILVLLTGGGHAPALLSIERDVVLDAPGGADRGATLYASNGPAALIRAVSRTLDRPLDDVAIVRFGDVRALVDELGGVRVDNPTPFVTGSFDGGRWWFPSGRIELDGRRALAYARSRSTSDRTRTAGESNRLRRQQRVLVAIARAFHPGSVLRHPFARARQLGAAAESTLSARDAVRLAWQLRGGVATRCRLGGRRAFVHAGEELRAADGRLVPRRDGLLLVARSADVARLVRMASGRATPASIRGGEHPTGCSATR